MRALALIALAGCPSKAPTPLGPADSDLPDTDADTGGPGPSGPTGHTGDTAGRMGTGHTGGTGSTADTSVPPDSGQETGLFVFTCDTGGAGVLDCAGACWPSAWVGDGVCDDGAVHPWGDPDFACVAHGWDGGDCPGDTGP